VSFEPGLTVAEMIEAAGIPPDLVALAMVEGERVPKDYRPRDGQTVKLMAVIGGGQRAAADPGLPRALLEKLGTV